MKAKIMSKTSKELFETFDKDNNTGFKTEDLVEIYQSHDAGEWSEEMTFEEMMAELDAIDEEFDARNSI